jgi:hypothetical protein
VETILAGALPSSIFQGRKGDLPGSVLERKRAIGGYACDDPLPPAHEVQFIARHLFGFPSLSPLRHRFALLLSLAAQRRQ